ncbi:MAG: hypothetical protein EU536_01200 [Promethearchaeota archaeon]|nr:MAG: hypothetical protein EU536_01200 [Candidatus Lokiarchaeota archaeon]
MDPEMVFPAVLFDYWFASYAVIATVFFFLAVISKNNAKFYGVIAGLSALFSFLSLIFATIYATLAGMAAGSVTGTFQFAISIVLLICGVFLVYFALDAKNKVKAKEACYSTFLLAICMFLIGSYLLVDVLPTLIRNFNLSLTDWSVLENHIISYQMVIPFPIERTMITIIPLTLFVIGAYMLKEMKSKRYESNAMQEADKFLKTYSKLDLEISRKLYHVVIIVVLVCYLFVGKLVIDVIYQFTLLGLPSIPSSVPGQVIYDTIIAAPSTGLLDFRAGHLLLILAVGWIMVILLFTDVVRIKQYRYYPIKMLAKVYRDKERLVLAPHIYLTTGIFFVLIVSSMIDQLTNTPAYLSYSAHIVTVTIMVSALADAVATIVGITKGKRHIKGGKKTWEGWIAGFISAVLLGLMSFVVLMPLYGGDLLVGILMSIVAAIVFGLIDYFSPPISDNILNPIAIGLVLWGIAFLF